MNLQPDRFEEDRRKFLKQAAATAVVSLIDPAAGALPASAESPGPGSGIDSLPPPEWVRDVTRMAFLTPGEVAKAASMGVQVVHTNLVWPYFPLRRDGGGLTREDSAKLAKLTDDCHRAGMRIALGLPPFPPVALVKEHPDWRVHPDNSGSALKIVPAENDLGTRSGCNNGPWGDYLIDVCCELATDYGLDGFSFDGNYHAALCFCPACKAAYKKTRQRDLPPRVDLDSVPYREYLVWRGERLEDHYRRLQRRLRQVGPGVALLSWTVNAGRYGHFLTSPRAMPSRMNLLFDLPMQEWWLDETNLGGSIAPAFGAAYLRAVAGDRPCASEAYLMSRGNPYGSDSFPAHERFTRCFLNLTSGGVCAESLSWPGHEASTTTVFREAARRERWLTRTAPLPWAALLVSEQTRQFYAYKDIEKHFLPHVFGAFRAATEEHLPLTLVNDWDIDIATLSRFAVLILPGAAALSDAQIEAVRTFVRKGGGLVATGESSLCDELGRPRKDFALADLFGVSYRGRPTDATRRPELDANFAITVDENYWRLRSGVATLTWTDHLLTRDAILAELVPNKRVTFRGPLVRTTEPAVPAEAAIRMSPEGTDGPPLPAAVLRHYGEGRVAYFAAAVDAALWSYAYPYQRRLLTRAVEWTAASPVPVSVKAPMCVHASYFVQADRNGKRIVIHLFNAMNTTANHGLPSMEVPLREEVVPIHGIRIGFGKNPPKSIHMEPGGAPVRLLDKGPISIADVPPLELHAMLVGEY
jgi:hypothetical protein